jgi:uncharacterized protein YdcH (DUF465 family)
MMEVPMRNSPRTDPSFQVHRLEQLHTDLKRRIADLDRRHFLNAREQQEVAHLKKQKLATKDALNEALRALNGG